MKQYRFSILMVIVVYGFLNLYGSPLHAQDTSLKQPISVNRSVAGKKAYPLRDTAKPAVPATQNKKAATGRLKDAHVPSGKSDSARLQSSDSRNRKDTTVVSRSLTSVISDSLKRPKSPLPQVKQIALPSFTGRLHHGYDQFLKDVLTHNALFKGTGKSMPEITQPVPSRSQDTLFYSILAVFFLLAIIRVVFGKYLSDLFRAFFNPTLSQRQLKDQLSQTPLPAWIMNFFFAVSAGMFLYLILRRSNYIENASPLYLIPIFVLLVGVIYLIKYIFLRFSGWLSGYQELMNGYIFTLYLINKVAGVMLMPFILLLAFSDSEIADVALDIALFIIVALFAYRYIRAYAMVKNQIFFSKFHFFVYLCGFEIVPVLMIGKVVLIWLNGA